jgi:preprotein translocase subunit SecD
MQKISIWKIILTILLSIIAVIYVIPNFTDKEYSWTPGDKVNLGLDLRGGSHLLLDVDFEAYTHELGQSIADSLKKYLRQQKVAYKNLSSNKTDIKVELRSVDDFQQVKKIVRNIDPTLNIGIDGNIVNIGYDEYRLNQIQDKVIDQSIEIVRMRVDSSGTKEPTIQRQGVKNILLQVPGEEDPSKLKHILGQTAKLTFHLVDETANTHKAASGQVPSGSIAVKSDETESMVVIKKKVIVSGDQLSNAAVSFNKDSIPVVHFSFNHAGAKKFAEATTQNRGKRLAIVLDGKILSAPVINEPIVGGDGIISGNFTVESAQELALLLRAGALPTQLKVIEERTIGPNLGADSIESGKFAALVGFVLVVVFMVLSYGVLGIFANITLVIDLVFIFALLSMLQATLTLPGIAGIILTIGMAVDANVLIYERIKEELAKGCSNLYAVRTGFDSAFATIMDSNITTLIAAFLLYTFGVGAIKGFAVTLTIGIIASMYGALIITKLMIDLWLKYWKPKTLGL